MLEILSGCFSEGGIEVNQREGLGSVATQRGRYGCSCRPSLPLACVCTNSN